ncbi:MAG: hypothetical protein GX944_00100, partial [Alphaproteobacteria bacterium]|nr:hypothetical protein [Alphaproteobacteria bacterium]
MSKKNYIVDSKEMARMEWNKTNTQLYLSTDGQYAISGRYTYYQGWTPYYLPNGLKGDWISLDGMYNGKGALAICREICAEHK